MASGEEGIPDFEYTIPYDELTIEVLFLSVFVRRNCADRMRRDDVPREHESAAGDSAVTAKTGTFLLPLDCLLTELAVGLGRSSAPGVANAVRPEVAWMLAWHRAA